MKILFLASRMPFPPDRGDRLRAFNIIKTLWRAGHEVDLASFVSGEKERLAAEELKPFCRKLVLVELSPLASLLSCGGALLGRRPLQAAHYRSRKMHEAVSALLGSEKFDVIYVHLFRMAQYVPRGRHEYTLVDFTDVISREIERSLPYRRGLNRIIYSIELPRVRFFESSVASSFRECWVVSDSEAAFLREMCPSANIRVIPNGVDLEAFRPRGAGAGKNSGASDPRGGNGSVGGSGVGGGNSSGGSRICGISIVSFVGHLGVPHNVDAVLHFYRDIFPLVLEQCPACTFQVTGPSAHRSLLPLKNDGRVLMTGFVEDLNEPLGKSSVFVAPLRYCAGLQNKVLEAMAAGVPVVATPCVNEGLGARDGEEILLASEAREFAEKVVSILKSTSLRNRISASARGFVERRFSWEHVAERMAAIETEIGSR